MDLRPKVVHQLKGPIRNVIMVAEVVAVYESNVLLPSGTEEPTRDAGLTLIA